MGLFDRKTEILGKSSFGKPKLPPGQTATDKFQVLTMAGQCACLHTAAMPGRGRNGSRE